MGASFGKAQKNDDLEPGELPDYNHRRSTKDGEGILLAKSVALLRKEKGFFVLVIRSKAEMEARY